MRVVVAASMLAVPCSLVLSLSGCGGGSSGGNSTTPVPPASTSSAPPVISKTTTPPAPSNTTSSPAPSNTTASPTIPSTASTTTHQYTTLPVGDRIPMYVVLRMDDISIGYVSQQQADAINWSVQNNVKFNFGIIAGDPVPWPIGCADNPEETYCDDPAVQAMTNAYKNGRVRGNMSEPDQQVIEIFDHAWSHDTWPDQFWGEDFKSWMEDDMSKSTTRLRAAFPDAHIRTMVAPENLATADVIVAMKANGLDIISAQGTLGCHSPAGSPPHYNYLYAPCEHDDYVDCVPEGDVYVTTDGWQPVNGVYSTPTGAANSLFGGGGDGITPEEAIGEGTCGCEHSICSMVAAAESNADKSSGLRWTVLMMHPQTEFSGVGSASYADWLDAFLVKCRESTKYDIRFLNFQDLVQLKSSQAMDALLV